jgi:hypothetical protein
MLFSETNRSMSKALLHENIKSPFFQINSRREYKKKKGTLH